ncbi:RHS repeat-associated core domain-containing protein [Streptomyces parvus]|uniref:RHS repeat-associated core domain-containing protein n=1 Tax=Streptomyces parvus TaxID=66428 RepID=UPI0035D95DF1
MAVRNASGINFVFADHQGTGLTAVDPTLGRFLSVDPLILPGDSTQLNPYVYGNNNAATFSDPTGEAYEECVSGQYKCTYGKGGTGDVKKVEFGKNHKKVTKSAGGTISPNYTIQQNTGYKHVYTKGSGVTAPTAAQRAASAEIERQNRIERERKAARRSISRTRRTRGSGPVSSNGAATIGTASRPVSP